MNKSEVCVKLTRNNCKKVLGILEMFGEGVWKYSRLNEGCFNWKHAFAMIGYCGQEWLISSTQDGKTVIKPRELRNILAKEHLKKGDVVILDGGEKAQFIARIDGTDDHRRWPFNSSLWTELNEGDRDVQSTEGSFDNFLRFASDEEKASLEPKQTIETVDPVNSFTGSIPGKTTYTREVWVNHYSDQEFHVHKKKSTADHLVHLNGNLGRHVKTVKATLTYDIPMTKV